ncbi:MAG: WGR domain-containing protein [Treponema sp.]|jgi:predicted DNA-binding WGR domain protein|nr:WGR domain-containing protein [Treponema sp.]
MAYSTKLVFKDEKSDKFWNIETNEKIYTVNYGKTGTAGQTQTKEFGSPAEAEAEAKKQTEGKKKKGYKEA